ncbi:MAG: NAD(P)-dependent oxidoreductase [Candidatus Promineifilaceae bacterium]
MKILITGVTGSVGPHVLKEMADHHEIRMMARGALDMPYELVIGDLLSLDDCRRAVAGAEAVVHIAGRPEPADDAVAVNVQGTYHLLEASREAEIRRFIFAGTNCVYGHCYPVTDRPFRPDKLPIEEDCPLKPEDNYGLSKALAERMLALYSQTWGMKTAALRLCWVWGEKEIAWRREMEQLDLARFAPYFWAYVDGRDVARAFRLALEANSLPDYGAYNISAADHMADEPSEELRQQFYPDVAVGKTLAGRNTFFDWQAAHNAFGYQPQFSWRNE